MKKTLSLLTMIAISSTLSAQEWVNGYTRQNGTAVDGHYRSTPNGNPNDNWSTKGNVNPITGSEGTRNPQHGGTITTPANGGYGSAATGRTER